MGKDQVGNYCLKGKRLIVHNAEPDLGGTKEFHVDDGGIVIGTNSNFSVLSQRKVSYNQGLAYNPFNQKNIYCFNK